MNSGGFSWRRFLGISAFKSRVSRQIGIPLNSSGRRKKLGSTIYNAVGPVAGTAAVAIAATKTRTSTESTGKRGVHFCEVKGVTHNNDDGTSRMAAQQSCSIGDTVRLLADPSSVHDRNAIRVVLLTGQQIGFISARQAARLHDKLQLLTATVYSRAQDQWGNDTIKLRVTDAETNVPARAVPGVESLKTEAAETGAKEGWKSTLIYFENPDGSLYQVVLPENNDLMHKTLQEGMARVGFIGLKDAPKGIEFSFSLDDSFPITGIVAKRFLVNAREWVTNRSKELMVQKGEAAPVVHDFQASNELKAAVRSNAKLGMVVSIGVVLFIGLLIVYEAWWAAVATAAIAFLIWRQASKRA